MQIMHQQNIRWICIKINLDNKPDTNQIENSFRNMTTTRISIEKFNILITPLVTIILYQAPNIYSTLKKSYIENLYSSRKRRDVTEDVTSNITYLHNKRCRRINQNLKCAPNPIDTSIWQRWRNRHCLSTNRVVLGSLPSEYWLNY